MSKPLQKIIVVGGGTAGWLSAACLVKSLKNTCCEVTLVESPNVPTIGVGEATIPSFVDFLSFLGISKADFIKKTQSTFKLGIRFYDWREKGKDYWHGFGDVGFKIDGKPFYAQWLKQQFNGVKSEFTDYSPSVVMAKSNKFFIPTKKTPSAFSRSTYALHFDSKLVSDYFQKYAVNMGVKHIKENVIDVNQDKNGYINNLYLDGSESSIDGDFFIDCSGQRGFLIGDVLKVGYDNWQNYLPVDRAVTIQTRNEGPLKPYTEAFAHEHGWRWRIPLQHRTGNGYIFCSQYCDDDNACKLLMEKTSEKILTDPKLIKFDTGKRRSMWEKNCLAIGLSSGFLEPLESTSIYLAMRAILNFVQMMPSCSYEKETAEEFNRLMDAEYECIRDFIVLHYCTSQRDDSEFWSIWKSAEIPESLQRKIELFKRQGRLKRNNMDLFSEDSWYSVLEGMGVRPDSYDWMVNASDEKRIKKLMLDIQSSLQVSVEQFPLHEEYLKVICERSS